MAMPFDFEIEQMMTRGSTRGVLEISADDKVLVNKMVNGSVTTLDSKLVDKMIEGSVETINSRIVESMLIGSQRRPEEEPPMDYCLPSLNRTSNDSKESKSTIENRQVMQGDLRRVYVDDFKGSDDKGHQEVPDANKKSFQTQYQPISTLSSAMPKYDRIDNDGSSVQELPSGNVIGTTWELLGSTGTIKRPSVSNPETRRNSPPPTTRQNRYTLPTNPLASSSSQKIDFFDGKKRTSKAVRRESGGSKGRASFPSYDGHDVWNDNDILAKMLGGSVNKRFDVTPEEKLLIKKMVTGSKSTKESMLVEKMVAGSKETHNHAIIEKMVAGSKETINGKIVVDMVTGSKYYEENLIKQRKLSNSCLGLGVNLEINS